MAPPPPHHRPNDPPPPTTPTPHYPTPLLRLKIHDLSDRSASTFLGRINSSDLLSSSVHTVLSQLYPRSSSSSSAANGGWPGTRSVTLQLSGFAGVAFTRGKALDRDHKEIHLSTEYLAGLAARAAAEWEHEVRGVLVHEMVHCWQGDGGGSAPSGLVEGIADWVRLRAGLGARHWVRRRARVGQGWDAGYEVTAWFLDWLEGPAGFGDGVVVRVNRLLREGPYGDEERFWRDRCGLGRTVGELWADYQMWLVEREGDEARMQRPEGEMGPHPVAESGPEGRVEKNGTEEESDGQDKEVTKEEGEEEEDKAPSEIENGWTELNTAVTVTDTSS